MIDRGILTTSARGALASTIPTSEFRREGGWRPDLGDKAWQLAAEMGWTAILVPEAAGGLGLGLADTVVLAEELGRSLFPAPFAETAAAATIVASQRPETWRNELLVAIVEGRMRIALVGPDIPSAHAPRTGPLAVDMHRSTLRGAADPVHHASSATCFLALATSLPPRGDPASVAVFVPADAEGVTVTVRQSLDLTCSIGAVGFDVNVRKTTFVELGAADLRSALTVFSLLTAADLVGCAQAALDLAVRFAGERHQFGVSIGSFQAIAHMLVDDFVRIDNARAALHEAAVAADANSGNSPIATAIAWDCAVEAALSATRACIQVHGAFGFSWDADPHLYLKRVRRQVALGGRLASREAISEALDRLPREGWDLLRPSAANRAPVDGR